jgi:hypothetical protein
VRNLSTSYLRFLDEHIGQTSRLAVSVKPIGLAPRARICASETVGPTGHVETLAPAVGLAVLLAMFDGLVEAHWLAL